MSSLDDPLHETIEPAALEPLYEPARETLQDTQDWPVVRRGAATWSGLPIAPPPPRRRRWSLTAVWAVLGLGILLVIGGWLALARPGAVPTVADVVVFSASPSLLGPVPSGSGVPSPGATPSGLSRGGSETAPVDLPLPSPTGAPSGPTPGSAGSPRPSAGGKGPAGATGPVRPPSTTRTSTRPPTSARPSPRPSTAPASTTTPPRTTPPPSTAPPSTAPPSTAPPTTAPPPPVTVTVTQLPPAPRCAMENGYCQLNTPVTLIYGTTNRYRYKWYVSGFQSCGNTAFGGDPAVAVFKSCWAAPVVACGSQGQRCEPPNGLTVIEHYLVNGRLVAIRGPQVGGFDCTGPTFGVPADPGGSCVITAISP